MDSMAGSRRVTGLETLGSTTIEYRNGNSKENSPIKLTGLNRVVGRDAASAA